MKLQKETKASSGHGKWYGDACGTAFAMELVGERWSMLIVRELMLGGRRFSDLRADLPGISAKVLTERLVGLEEAGVVTRRQLPPPAGTHIYELTPWGYLAEPAIQELGRWAARSPSHDPTLPISPVGLMISTRTLLNKELAPALTATIGYDFDGVQFVARLKDGAMPVTREEVAGADAVFRAPTPMHVAALLYRKIPPGEWERGPGCEIAGDRVLARRFIDLFALPEKVS